MAPKQYSPGRLIQAAFSLVKESGFRILLHEELLKSWALPQLLYTLL
jgi:hypothetical protein